MPIADGDRCPCRSRLTFGECCGPYLAGGTPPTAVALMRSRFTAYALRDADHLLRTWHASTRPEALELDDDVAWVGLQIVDSAGGRENDGTGTVHFRASYRTPTDRSVMQEVSTFVKLAGAWFYVAGNVR
ncbi:YchJ family protein [Serinibacter arcticus]|uniref:YchJ family protein n=1 Tax=Serinibacter arcticus TaxID=1655435 RepID=UPI001F2E17A3|nr:YchJ family metal-binding protein [Serinibacter arcticus]